MELGCSAVLLNTAVSKAQRSGADGERDAGRRRRRARWRASPGAFRRSPMRSRRARNSASSAREASGAAAAAGHRPPAGAQAAGRSGGGGARRRLPLGERAREGPARGRTDRAGAHAAADGAAQRRAPDAAWRCRRWRRPPAPTACTCRPAAIRRRARSCSGPDKLIGVSIHTATEAAAVDPAIVDYAIAGPAFETASKPGYGPEIGRKGLGRSRPQPRVPILAIGGLNAMRAAEVLAAGAPASR